MLHDTTRETDVHQTFNMSNSQYLIGLCCVVSFTENDIN